MYNTQVLKERLASGECRKILLDLYANEGWLDYQTKRYIDAIEQYELLFGQGDISVYSAPGRSEVGGNHTDHQHGEILAAAINLDAIAVVSQTDDNVITIFSDGIGKITVDIDNVEIGEKGTTASLVKGVLVGMRQRGYLTGGFKAYITSDVKVGSGLSSSAAFEVLIGTIISNIYNEGKIDSITIAIISQYSENVYFGKPCGLMDQMACAVGNLVHVDFGNVANPVVEKVDLDLNRFDYSLCITDTQGSHANLTDEYAAVPKEMKEIASFFGKEFLVEITYEDIIQNIDVLRKKYGDRAVLRAIHFLTENERVKKEVEALKKEDISTFLELVKKSGDSSYKYLQNVYVSNDVVHQNISVALAVSDIMLSDGSGVSRVHGGGFAGTIQAFVQNQKVKRYSEEMNKVFGEGSCRILKIRKYGGIKVNI